MIFLAYLALYRKWRPQIFEDVIGQEHITKTLKNQISSDRIAHAYLFCGTRGTGKTSTAKIFSRAVNCQNSVNGNPCNKCDSCVGILNGSLLDVCEIDAASNNSVDDVRLIRDEVAYSPSGLLYKVYIIDEVHMLTTSAFNALLKTLEEPPSRVIFILATTEAHKIPVTILSRCQRFDFKRISTLDIAKRLDEVIKNDNINISNDAKLLLARVADGSMRDALSVLDQCLLSDNKEISYDMVANLVGAVDTTQIFNTVNAISNYDIANALVIANEISVSGRDVGKLIDDIINHLRSLVLCLSCNNPQSLIECSDEALKQYMEQSKDFSTERLLAIIKIFSNAASEIKYATSKRTVLEVALVKACSNLFDYSIEGLYAKITELEKKIEQGSFNIKTEAVKKIDDKPKIQQIIAENNDIIKNIELESKQNEKSFENEAKAFQNRVDDLWASVLNQLLNNGDFMISNILSLCLHNINENNFKIIFKDKIYKEMFENNKWDKTISDAVFAITGESYKIELDITDEAEIENNQNDKLYKIINLKDKLGEKLKIVEED